MTNDAIEIHFKGAGLAYDSKIAPGDTAEAEKARKIATFILDMVAGDADTAAGAPRKPRRARADASADLSTSTTEVESL